MAQFVVRNIENGVKARLQRRARRNGRSMEEEIRDILRDAVNKDDAPAHGLGTEITSLFARSGLDADIPELRGHAVTPPHFEE
jgi:plasmid stability protein